MTEPTYVVQAAAWAVVWAAAGLTARNLLSRGGRRPSKPHEHVEHVVHVPTHVHLHHHREPARRP